jgi:hypothetical protein
VYGGEKPVPLWLEDSEESTSSSLKRILFSLVIRIKVCCENTTDLFILNTKSWFVSEKVSVAPGFYIFFEDKPLWKEQKNAADLNKITVQSFSV